jgi:peptide/nickel transport system substrate-binding protein/oligopeptide transport system substrate-binding protein
VLKRQRLPCVAITNSIVLVGLIGVGWIWWGGQQVEPRLPQLNPSPQYGGVYRRGLIGEPFTLDPARVTSTFEALVVQQLFDSLVQFDAELNVIPSIAHSWNASYDGLVWTFSLRKGVKFHNGRDVVADDFVYSFTRMMDPEIPSAGKSIFARVKGAQAFLAGQVKQIEGLQALDDYTLRIVLSQPYAPLVRALGMWSFKVVPKEEVERLGEAFGRSPVGTGAFRFVAWKPGETITLEANETYFEQRPYLDQIVFRIFHKAPLEVMFAEFEANRLEDSKIPVDRREQLLNDSRYQHIRIPIFQTLFLWMDYREGPLRDRRVRRAIDLAIDRSYLVQTLRKGRFPEAHSIIPPGMFAYNPQLPKNKYDVEKAKQLLAEAGYPSGAGMPPLELWSGVESPASVHDHHAIKDFLAKIGIQVQLRTASTWKEYVDQVCGKRPGSIFRYAWYPSMPDPDEVLYVLFHSQSEFNRGHYHNEKVDRLLEQGRDELDDSKRSELYREAEKLIIADVPTINLVHYTFERLFHPYVHGVNASSLDEHYIPMKTIWLDMAQHGFPQTAKTD